MLREQDNPLALAANRTGHKGALRLAETTAGHLGGDISGPVRFEPS